MATTAVKQMKNFINGKWVESTSDEKLTVPNPATGEALAEVPVSTKEDVEKAVAAAEAAFESWWKTPVPDRARILFDYHQLLRKNADELAHTLTLENGKTIKESKGEIQRGIESVEAASSAPSLMMGETLPEISSGIEGATYRYPLGVVAGITPFNFPAMIPLWMAPIAVACGNTFVLKPSERTPLTAERLVELFMEAGLPEGVLNIVNGAHDVVNGLLDSPSVEGVSFVGSQPVAEYVYKRAGETGKRVQALAGAKNHAIVMPDCHMEKTVQGVANAAFGSAGQRCMATSVVAVADEVADEFIEKLREKAENLKVGDGQDDNTTINPLIRESHAERVRSYIEQGEAEGAKLVLDGRKTVAGSSNKNDLGATIFDGVTTDMSIWQNEIFGPVLSIVRISDLHEGVELANQSLFANGGVIYTESGKTAREFREHIDAGLIGVNVNVPASMAFFPFAGNKHSFYGDLGTNGKDGVRFYTRQKIVTKRWFS